MVTATVLITVQCEDIDEYNKSLADAIVSWGSSYIQENEAELTFVISKNI